MRSRGCFERRNSLTQRRKEEEEEEEEKEEEEEELFELPSLRLCAVA
jgi:hypothetical protein